jgi:ubiquitin carboxyl-terminal hydrolase 14
VRFYWKQESVTSGTEGGKAKILRSVSFPNRLDVFEFCSAELKKSLDLGRDFERKQREAEDNKALNNKGGADVEMKDETAKPVEETKEE